MSDLTAYEWNVVGALVSALAFGLFGLALVLRSLPPKRKS